MKYMTIRQNTSPQEKRGDIVGVDADIMLLGLVTDTKRFAYILQDGEKDVPENLQEALNKVNRLHETFSKEFKIGRTGKEIFDAAQNIPLEEGIITTTMVFHPPPMFIRRFLQGGFMFSNQSYLAGMTSSPVNYSTAIVLQNHKLYYNTLFPLILHLPVLPLRGGVRTELRCYCGM